MCNKWVDIAEDPPPSEVGILVTDGSVVTVCKMLVQKDGYRTMIGHEFGGYEWDYDIDSDEITHWMHLPSPPTRR